MKIVVCAKQTFDTEAKIALDASGNISTEGVNLVLDPYSEFAVEEGIRTKEKMGGEVIVLTVGPDSAQGAIRQALAMGADSGVLVCDSALDGGDASGTALALAKALEKLNADIIIGGFKSVDNGTAQVLPRVATIMNIPHVNVVVKIELNGDKAVATREIDDGVELIEVPMPALFTAQQGLAEPRYPSMKGIMQAKKKPLDVWSLADIGVDSGAVGAAGAKVKVLKLTLPDARKGGKIIGGEVADAAAEMVKLTRTEAKVI